MHSRLNAAAKPYAVVLREVNTTNLDSSLLLLLLLWGLDLSALQQQQQQQRTAQQSVKFFKD
jgi:hypothetical protein